jgi:hypothetical protein
MLSRENSSQDFEDEFRIGHYDYKYNDYWWDGHYVTMAIS